MDKKIPSFQAVDYLELFLSSREETNRAPGTLRNYRRAITSFFDCPQTPDDLSCLQPAHTLFWLKWIREQGLGDSYRRWHQRHLWVFLHWLYESRYVTEDPRRGIPRVEALTPIRPQVTAPDITKFLTAALGALLKDGTPKRHYYRDIAILRMFWATGLRVSELAALNFENIDMEHRIAFVAYAKGKKQREVPFDAPTKRALLEYLLRERGKADGSLFRMTSSGIRQMLDRVAIRAKADRKTPHAFRRGFARRMRKSGLDLGETASLLGHETLAMTRIYSQEGEGEAAIEAYRRLIG